MTLPRSLRLAALTGAAALALTLTACGDSGFVAARDAVPAGSSGPAAAAAVPPGGLATGVTAVGTVVTTDGFTLYRFAKDSTDPSRSACVGDCAVKWPPLHGDGQPALRGIPSGLIGTVGRPDGTSQLTLNGWPLYRYSGDTRPGDANGEGVGGTWAAMGVNGTPAATAPGTAAPGAAAPTAAPAGAAAPTHAHGR